MLITIDRFCEVLGADYLINVLGQNLNSESTDLKIDLLKWLLKNEDGLKKCDLKSLIPHLITCQIDKNKDVRLVAESVTVIGVKHIGIEIFKNFI